MGKSSCPVHLSCGVARSPEREGGEMVTKMQVGSQSGLSQTRCKEIPDAMFLMLLDRSIHMWVYWIDPTSSSRR